MSCGASQSKLTATPGVVIAVDGTEMPWVEGY